MPSAFGTNSCHAHANISKRFAINYLHYLKYHLHGSSSHLRHVRDCQCTQNWHVRCLQLEKCSKREIIIAWSKCSFYKGLSCVCQQSALKACYFEGSVSTGVVPSKLCACPCALYTHAVPVHVERMMQWSMLGLQLTVISRQWWALWCCADLSSGLNWEERNSRGQREAQLTDKTQKLLSTHYIHAVRSLLEASVPPTLRAEIRMNKEKRFLA